MPLNVMSADEDGEMSRIFSTKRSKIFGWLMFSIFLFTCVYNILHYGEIISFLAFEVPFTSLTEYSNIETYAFKTFRNHIEVLNFKDDKATQFCDLFNDENADGKLAMDIIKMTYRSDTNGTD